MANGRCRMHGGTAKGAPKGNSRAFKHGRYTAKAIAERRHFADLLREMKGFIDEVDGADWTGPASDFRPAQLGSYRRLASAGGGSAGFRKRHTREPGSHLGFAGSHPVQSRGNRANTAF